MALEKRLQQFIMAGQLFSGLRPRNLFKIELEEKEIGSNFYLRKRIRNWPEYSPGNPANLETEMIFKTVEIGESRGLDQRWFFGIVSGMPKTDPVITGLKSMYSVGEFVHANCTSAESYPIAALRWYINDNQVRPKPEENRRDSPNARCPFSCR